MLNGFVLECICLPCLSLPLGKLNRSEEVRTSPGTRIEDGDEHADKDDVEHGSRTCNTRRFEFLQSFGFICLQSS
jgi:hypothetical protein